MKAAVVESLIALGVTDGGDGGLAGDSRVEALGEVAQGVVAEAPGNVQGTARRRAHQGFNPGEGGTPQQYSHQ